MIALDLEEAYSHEDIPKEVIREAILRCLRELHFLGAEVPGVYGSMAAMSTQAFQVASTYVAGKLREAREKQEAFAAKEEHLADLATREYKFQDAWTKYQEFKDKHDGDKVRAFCDFLKSDIDLQGYSYFLVCYRIPMDERIYDNEEVIDAFNAHPVLHDREKSRMEINGNRADIY